MKKFLLSHIHLKILWLFFFIVCIAGNGQLYAQRICGTPVAVKHALEKNPKLLEKYNQLKNLAFPPAKMEPYLRGQAVVIIPVVVHIVLQNPNLVSDAQVQSQINVLNADYNADNADSVNIPGVWKSLFGDMRVQFCLAERTPDGNPTNGIDRVTTNQTQFSDEGDAYSTVKHASSGGVNAWDPSKYLNFWVCNLSDNVLGVGTFPVLFPQEEQGVVIQYNAFGTI
ncbi:MAG: hypothetical protein ACRDE2_17805, partial [Chitinophagaceae bacterium]